MLIKVLTLAGLVAISGSTSALAGPAEFPPASFKGAQYMDSQGCVFMRATSDGRTSWIPRIGRDRKAICAGKPMKTVASLPEVTKNGCPAAAPYGARVVLTDGRRSLICSPDAELDPGAAVRRIDRTAVDVVVPNGYRKAWDDGRLNPHRAKGTAQGQAQQDLVWTNDVPARLVETTRRTKAATY